MLTLLLNHGSVGGTVDNEPALRSAGLLVWRVRAKLQAPWPAGGHESLESPCFFYWFYIEPSHSLFFILLTDGMKAWDHLVLDWLYIKSSHSLFFILLTDGMKVWDHLVLD
ncbi:hypothetical protein PoB_000457400 [Plakobranchus ocellatus]|uniref:Uncharacterized protein n=1 Tax=Plakobranchus ocellatus TaxID=259542 RepID=A0AAV3Y7L6_9GAST|nr:hypothetical protein PoB_000457400 [Plakobranchus ocellatus]